MTLTPRTRLVEERLSLATILNSFRSERILGMASCVLFSRCEPSRLLRSEFCAPQAFLRGEKGTYYLCIIYSRYSLLVEHIRPARASLFLTYLSAPFVVFARRR